MATNHRGTIREEAVNTLLARSLSLHGMKAKAERRGRKGTPDVLIELKTGDTLLLECKWADAASSLEHQLDERLETFPDEVATVGILYPNHLKQVDDIEPALTSTSDLIWYVHGTRGTRILPLRQLTGAVSDLADHLRTLPLELEGIDRVIAAAGVVDYRIEEAARLISSHRRLSRRIAEIIARTDQENNRRAALRIGCLVLFNALAFQDRLSVVDEDVPMMEEALGGGVAHTRNIWSYICESIDYVPVFELAAHILDVLADGPDELQTSVLQHLAKAVSETRNVEGHDLSGRLFHTLLTNAKFTGAYYTSVPAATMLARLVFHEWPPQVDWSDHEFPASLNVADLACGTGTLLMAVAAEAERRHVEADGQQSGALHKAMVEQALHGYDVQLSAVHFAATSLAMLNPNIQFDRMNLYVMPLGAEGDNVSLGSLDFLGEDEAAVQFPLSSETIGPSTLQAERVTGSGNVGATEGVTARLPELDLVIMNPPFTRSVFGNMLFGSVDDTERPRLREELARRLKHRPASATAGLGAAFVAAATPKLRPGDGRLALVLPLTVCTGPSWQQTRNLMATDFNLNIVIASHDPMKWNFSDSTSLSEALLIATRRGSDESLSEHRTIFVNLWQNPGGVLDAHRIGQAISTTTPAELEGTGESLLEVAGQHVGDMLSMPTSAIASRQWIGVQFARSGLTRSALRLFDDNEVWIPGASDTAKLPMCRLAEVGRIGPDVRRLDDGFDRTESTTAYPLVDGHNTEHRRSIVCEPDLYLSPLVSPRGGQRPGYGEHLWTMSGRLLVAARFRLNTARVVALRSDVNVLGRMWWPIQVGDDAVEKALAVWLNSSLGILSLMALRNTTEGSWVQPKKADLQDMPVLDFRAVTDRQIELLAGLFDTLSTEEFRSLPEMADCDARRLLDSRIADILSLPDLDGLRRLLAAEPVISNHRL